MNKRTFEEWFSTFRDTLDSYEDYRIDYRKAQSKISSFKVEIYILNSLICSENIEQDFEELVAEYPKCLNAVQIILDIYGVNYDFAAPNQSIEQYKYFMRETGLFDMLQNHIISNLYDYVTGVEVGLDSNGRKNRGGHQMERLVARHIRLDNRRQRLEICAEKSKRNFPRP